MKKLLLAFSFVATGFFASAQTEAAPNPNPARTTQQQAVIEMSEYYGLYEEQVTYAKVLQASKSNNLAEIESLKNTKPKEYLERKLAICDQTELAIREVLDAEQIKKFEARYKLRQSKRDMKASDMKKMELSEAAQISEWMAYEF
ncbi:MAG: hypothetical protein RL757_340 [Bacteroidota bacterium]|jgi:hypothetical protein